MVKVVDLTPRREPQPQCSVTIQEMTSPTGQFYNKYRKDRAARNNKDPQRCQKSSKWLIDGRYLCAFHAGIEALKILEAQSDD